MSGQNVKKTRQSFVNTLLLKDTAKSLIVGDNEERSSGQQINPELLQGNDHGQSFSIACKILLFGACHDSAKEMRRMKPTIGFLLSKSSIHRYIEGFGVDSKRNVEVGEAQYRRSCKLFLQTLEPGSHFLRLVWWAYSRRSSMQCRRDLRKPLNEPTVKSGQVEKRA